MPPKGRRYIAKPDTWFDAGSVAEWICDIVPGEAALFAGIRHGRPDEETCPYEEFEVINDPASTPMV